MRHTILQLLQQHPGGLGVTDIWRLWPTSPGPEWGEIEWEVHLMHMRTIGLPYRLDAIYYDYTDFVYRARKVRGKFQNCSKELA